MAQKEPVDLSQPTNKLSAYADVERAKLIPKNDYTNKNEYSAVNPDALADGDEKGKGTGGDLDIHNFSAGAKQDILERKNELTTNLYQQNKPYTTPGS